MNSSFWFVTLVFQAGGDEPPLTNRPANFSYVVGSYTITVSATPVEVEVEKPIVLTVRIQGSGPEKHQPRRKHLRIFPDDFDQQFFVEPLPDQDQFQKGIWEFVYRLRPKSTAVKFIPGLKLVYYHPGRKRYTTTPADAIALTVKPATPSKVELPAVKTLAPEEFLHLRPLDEASPWRDDRRPEPWVLVVGLTLPPLLCWCFGWYRPRRGAARNPNVQTSRAAQETAQELQKADSQGLLIGAILAKYFRVRLKLSALEPTPEEIVEALRRASATKDMLSKAREQLRRLEAIRFQFPGAAGGVISSAEAIQIVDDVEGQLCTRQY